MTDATFYQATTPAGRQRIPWLLRRFWHGYGFALAVYAVLSILLSWPVIRDFTRAISSDGGNDARLNIWILWHTQQALLFRQPLLGAPTLYWPLGTSLLTQSPGPLMGLFALPFWPLGVEATYNATLMVGLTLTGFCMYLLARELGLRRWVALFAGVVYMTVPMALGGLLQHMDKTFLGLLPLTVWAMLRAFDPRRSIWWGTATAAILALTILHGGWHFVQAVFAVAFFLVVFWLTNPTGDRRFLWQRTLVLGVSVLVLVGPFLVGIARASADPALHVDNGLQSYEHHPDLAEFFLPSQYSILFGPAVLAFLERFGITPTVETAVSLVYTGLILAVIGVVRGGRRAIVWLLFTLFFFVLALGPVLKVLGQKEFTLYKLPIILPYAVVSDLPGMAFMRTPGRFMMMAFVGFAILAAFGLQWLVTRFPSWRRVLPAAAIALVLIEVWPRPWPTEVMRPVPDFYKQIASDPAMYGVFDLPQKPRSDASAAGYSSFYQMYQMTHHKGIATGFLSFTPPRHPLFPGLFQTDPTPPDALVNGQKVSSYTNAAYELAEQGYRYVVRHKPDKNYAEFKPGSRGDKIAEDFVRNAFPNQAPIVDDDLTTVYALPATADPAILKLYMEMRSGWQEREDKWRWTTSPATLYILSPTAQQATLQITPSSIHDPEAEGGVGQEGVLTVEANGTTTKVPIRVDEPTDVPLTLVPGGQTVTLSLDAGNFHPSDYGVGDTRELSFAIKTLNLKTR
ncbi:MAG: hypothetical protein U0822_12420 [Anaerolineae bacterium]